jgi:hypothetical protein
MIKVQKQFKYLVCGGLTLFTLASAAPANAVSFVSTFLPPGLISAVGTIDPTNGQYTNYNSFELQLTDLALSPTNELFGVTYDQLYRLPAAAPGQILPGSGQQIIVGNLGFTGINGLAFDGKGDLYALGGRNTNGDNSNPNQYNNGNPGFYKISTSAPPGATLATLISNLGALAPTAFGDGTATNGDTSDLIFDPNRGKFLAVAGNKNAQLFSIDPLTGSTDIIGNGTGLDFVSGLTLDGGILRGYTTTKEQYTIDIATGKADLSSKVNINGIVILPGNPNPLIGGAASTIATTAVPEPSSAGGFAFLGVCFTARYLLKRKQQLSDDADNAE